MTDHSRLSSGPRSAPDKPARLKRVYEAVSVSPEAPYRILLDGRPVKTPLRRSLETVHRPLAEAVANEWQAQTAEIEPERMPLTRLLSTAVDRVADERPAMTASLLAYLDTDLLCYRAPHPAELTARQAAVWQPVLDWGDAAHGIRLNVVSGILPVDQPPDAVDAARVALDRFTAEEFTALQAAVGATGSFMLGLALVAGRIGSAEVFSAAQLDETYQIEQWGEDAEALDRRRRIAAEIEGVGQFLALIRTSS